MTKEEVVAQLKVENSTPCTECIDRVFQHLMDPQTQGLLPDYAKLRDGILHLHVHRTGPLDGPPVEEGVIFFRTFVRITKDNLMLYSTPASPTVLGAFEKLKEVIRLESLRLRRHREEKARQRAADAKERAGTQG